ncbi:MAG: allantoin racemase, partial [Mycobacterium sp.]|nr:allantoin racemase [Mycobacterium sp.]
MTRLTVINPNTSGELTDTIAAAAQAVSGAGVTVVGVNPSVGVPSVESHAEETIGAVGVLQQVREHQADTDAFVIACFGDTGVQAAREIATCPVVGMTEAALQ